MNSEIIRKEIIIDWQNIFLSVMKRWWLILLCFVIGAGSGYGLGCFADVPVYETEAVYVLSYSGGDNSIGSMSSEYSFISRILYNCTEIVRQNTFAQMIADRINEGLTEDSQQYLPMDDLMECIEYSYSTAGTLMYVTVDTGSAELSYEIITAVMDYLPDYIKQQYRLAGADAMVFSLINTPLFPEEPVDSRTRLLFTVIGALAFSFICAAVIAFIALADNRIKKEEDLKNKYNAPILGIIPDFKDPELKKGGYYKYASSTQEKGK